VNDQLPPVPRLANVAARLDENPRDQNLPPADSARQVGTAGIEDLDFIEAHDLHGSLLAAARVATIRL
jgi:hypothetical protein